MAYDYAGTAASATKLLTKFGRTVTRTTYTAGTFDQATQTVSPSTAASSRIGVLFDIDGKRTTIRGTLVQVGDKELYLDASAAVALTDHYTIGGVEYIVLSFEEINPAGTAVLHILHLRRA
jgi:hypothetical protein